MIVKGVNKDKPFANRQEFIDYFKANKSTVLACKKAALKTEAISPNFIFDSSAVSKSNLEVLKHGDSVKNVINSIHFYDSHGDVHLKGNWNKTAKEQNGRIHHAINHDLSVGNIVAYPKDVNLFVTTATWKSLGIDAEGSTEIFAAESKLTDKSNSHAFKGYRDQVGFQHSPRMRYIDGAFAIKSDDPDLTEENALFEKVYPHIVNKQDLVEDMFFAVKEAAISGEFSTVINGSNYATTQLINEPQKSTPHEPSSDTRIDYKAIKANFKLK